MRLGAEERIEELRVFAYTIPTDAPESDGTLEWDSTTAIVVEAVADDWTGLGYSYGAPAAAWVADDLLRPEVLGGKVRDVGAAWSRMVAAVRNVGENEFVAHATRSTIVAIP